MLLSIHDTVGRDTSRSGTAPLLVTWSIAAITILLVLIRPKRIPEAIWACGGALLLVILGRLPLAKAFHAVGKGADVYLFLTGMMCLSELARREGLFDWVAAVAVGAARGSRKRLFAILYVVGIVVTAFLSNDATAVVLTPAVLAAVKKVRAKPLPYLLICAFIANAASFLLPISNPANLVVYGSKMPPLTAWLRVFALPSVLAVGATYVVLRLSVSRDLNGDIDSNVDRPRLSDGGKRAALGILFTAVALLAASAFNVDLGPPTLGSAVAAIVLVSFKHRDAALEVAKEISWSVLPLVAGLFVLVEAIDGAGALALGTAAVHETGRMAQLTGGMAAAFGVALISNVANNLPVCLITGGAIQAAKAPELIRNALLIGVDLGPNLSVTGSLATILWLMAIRREGEDVSFWKFLRYGAIAMPPALALAVIALLWTSR